MFFRARSNKKKAKKHDVNETFLTMAFGDPSDCNFALRRIRPRWNHFERKALIQGTINVIMFMFCITFQEHGWKTCF
jgi:hypothetical protein